ncbi:MAG: serpin family protein [Ruminococcaceae bacterium]|nr:serpin family protein [Oscillospiraceae bacterium]
MKKFISLILVLTICLAFSSCAVNPENYSLALAAKAIEVEYSDAKEESYENFLDKLDAFASKLTYEVYADSNKQSNICISPVSVYMALALATECSGGETRDEILNAVGVTYDEVKNFTKVLYAFSNREYYYTNMMNNKKILAFEELANSIWVDKNTTLKEDGINDLASNFNCDLFSVNFKTSEGEKAINAYIKDKTHGVIDSDLDLSPETLITLINTFYLKEVWNEDGDELKFTDKAYDFKNADGSMINTKLLQGYYFNGNIYEGEGYTSFYTRTEHGFDIKFILPTDGHTLEEVFTSDNIYNINNLGDYGYIDEENKLLHHTRVFFPEYKASFDGDLAEILKNDFGINDLFDFEQCDLSNVTDEKLACDGVIHKCSIDVNDRGIEGAAVTVMPMAGAAGPLDGYEEVYHDYIVDRAFGFVITDSYGAVLFAGVVNSVN